MLALVEQIWPVLGQLIHPHTSTAVWVVAIWVVYGIAPHFMLLVLDVILLPFLPPPDSLVGNWPLLKDAHIIQLSIVHILLLELCKRQVYKRGRAIQRQKSSRMTSSSIMLLLHSALAAAILREAVDQRYPPVCASTHFRTQTATIRMAQTLWLYFVVKLVHDVARGMRLILESHPHIQTIDTLAILKLHPPTYWVWWLIVRYEPGGSAYLLALLECTREVICHSGKLLSIPTAFPASLLVLVEFLQFVVKFLSIIGLLGFQCHCAQALYIGLPGVLVATGALFHFLWQCFRGQEGFSIFSMRHIISGGYGWSIIIGQCQRAMHAVLLKEKSASWGLVRKATYLILNEKTSTWEIPRKGLEVGNRIGGGAYGDVYVGRWRGSQVAIKRFKRSGKEDEYERYVCFKEEVNVLNRLRHPRIVEFMGATSRGGELQIVTELLQHGSLYDFLHGPKGMIQRKKVVMDERRAIKICESIAMGMVFLHTNEPPILHMDLQPGNLLMCDWASCKLCDFGLSKFKFGRKGQGSPEPPRGAPQYRAPELISAQWDIVSEKADVYSFGILMWEIFTTNIPWDGDMVEQVFYMVCNCNERPSPLPETASELYLKLMQECWQEDPQKRPNFVDISACLREALTSIGGSASNPTSPRGGSPSLPGTPRNDSPEASPSASPLSLTSPQKSFSTLRANFGSQPTSPDSSSPSQQSLAPLTPLKSFTRMRTGSPGGGQLSPTSPQKSFTSLPWAAAYNRTEADAMSNVGHSFKEGKIAMVEEEERKALAVAAGRALSPGAAGGGDDRGDVVEEGKSPTTDTQAATQSAPQSDHS